MIDCEDIPRSPQCSISQFIMKITKRNNKKPIFWYPKKECQKAQGVFNWTLLENCRVESRICINIACLGIFKVKITQI